MNCEKCGTAMKWVGSLVTGTIVCPHCSCCEVPEKKEPSPTEQLYQQARTSLDLALLRGRKLHTEYLLDEGVVTEVGNEYHARCCRCDSIDEIPCDIMEIDVDYQHYCGRDPRCCP